MTIYWNDGSAQVYELAALRKACPCASCQDLRRQLSAGDSLTLLTTGAMNPSTQVSDVNTVGRYAIQLTWGDGHNTGLYTYEFLREAGVMTE